MCCDICKFISDELLRFYLVSECFSTAVVYLMIELVLQRRCLNLQVIYHVIPILHLEMFHLCSFPIGFMRTRLFQPARVLAIDEEQGANNDVTL